MPKEPKKEGHNGTFISTTPREEEAVRAATFYTVDLRTRSGREVRDVPSLPEAVRFCRESEVCYSRITALVYAKGEIDGIERGALCATYKSQKGWKCVEILAAAMVAAVG